MQFGQFPVSGASGAILAHGVRGPGLSFRKGHVLSPADIALLIRAGIAEVTIARPEENEIGEDEAARRIAAVATAQGARLGAAFTGRANLYARAHGLALIDPAKIDAVNAVDEAITVASLAPFALVHPRQMLATIKIIPFAVKADAVARAETLLGEGAVGVAAFVPHLAGLILTMLPAAKPELLDKGYKAIGERLRALGSEILFEARVPHEVPALARAIADAAKTAADPILILGASAITDRGDMIPAAVGQAGGRIECFGMPVDPGNLLLLGEIQGRRIVGLPGCARSPKLNGFDFVLRRMLAGLPVGRMEIAAMGVGGLLSEISSRPQPREVSAKTPRLPRVGAIVLAAGKATRMGKNKLLEPTGGMPLVRHAVLAACASAADPVVVVTGNEAEKIRAALAPLPLLFANNSNFSNGLSTSLKCGLNALPADSEGAIILLGDMPKVSADLIDRLIAAFDPDEGRSIVVPAYAGRRGNPVLWGKAFFDEMQTLEGDAGARSLLARHSEQVREIEAGSDAPLADIDTPEALEAHRAAVSK